MSQITAGSTAPDFTLPVDGGGAVKMSELKGKSIVLYFYPKDDTPGCTTEAIAFTGLLPEFESANAVVIGVSADSVAKHDKFKAKHDLGIVLGSDESLVTLKAYGVWIEKSMYGKKYMGIDRSTFLIGPDSVVSKVWRKVKVPGHAEEVLAKIKASA